MSLRSNSCMMKKFLVLSIVIFICCSCKEKLKINLNNTQSITITDYSVLREVDSIATDEKIKSIILDSKSNEVKQIYSWLVEHEDSWELTEASYVQGYCWYIDGYKFNLLYGQLIAQKDNMQFINRVDNEDNTFDFITNLFGDK